MPQTNCFIQITSQEYQLYSFLFFYFPIEVSFTFNVIVIIIVIVKIRRKLAQSNYQTKSVFVLFIYPGIIFICWVLVLHYYLFSPPFYPRAALTSPTSYLLFSTA